MLLRVGRTAVLEVGSGELLAVVAEAEPTARANLPVDLSEVDVLIEASRIVVSQRQQSVSSGHRGGIGRNCGWQDIDYVGLCVSLSVVVEEKEYTVFFDRAAEIAAELMEVVRRACQGCRLYPDLLSRI